MFEPVAWRGLPSIEVLEPHRATIPRFRSFREVVITAAGSVFGSLTLNLEHWVACRFLDILRVRIGSVGRLCSLLTVSEKTSNETGVSCSTRRVSPF